MRLDQIEYFALPVWQIANAPRSSVAATSAKDHKAHPGHSALCYEVFHNHIPSVRGTQAMQNNNPHVLCAIPVEFVLLRGDVSHIVSRKYRILIRMLWSGGQRIRIGGEKHRADTLFQHMPQMVNNLPPPSLSSFPAFEPLAWSKYCQESFCGNG